jgi:putative methylase
MKLRQLEMILERVRSFDAPSERSEQYQTPAPLAARLLHTAMLSGDITGKNVLDLGCGTGILAIGAALLGAKVSAVEVDPAAVRIAEENASELGCSIRFIISDITGTGASDVIPVADTVIMNPPFGAQKEHADRPFIDMALQKAGTVYGIFNSGSLVFINEYIRGRGVITASLSAGLVIPRTFWFHTHDKHEIPVEIHLIKRV